MNSVAYNRRLDRLKVPKYIKMPKVKKLIQCAEFLNFKALLCPHRRCANLILYLSILN